MTKFRIASVLVAMVMAIALFASVASAQGVTVVTGTVTIDGTPAPTNTVVRVLQGTTVIGTGNTGANGLNANQYRIDITASAQLEGLTIGVVAVVGGVNSPTPAPTATFNANRVLTVNVAAVTPPPAGAAVLAIEPNAGPSGTAVNLRGTNFFPNSLVTITSTGGTISRTVTTNAAGAFDTAYAVSGGVNTVAVVTAEDARARRATAPFAVLSGSQGAQGPAGPAGPAGATGPAGAAGAAGAVGPAGAAGAAGAAGRAGEPGPAGEDGSAALGVVALILSIVAILVGLAAMMRGMKKKDAKM